MSKNCVCVAFNGYIIFPTPLVTFSRSTQDDGTGRILGATLSINLEGKIYNAGFANASDRATFFTKLMQDCECGIYLNSNGITDGIGTSSSGIDGIMEEERALRKIFTNSNHLASDNQYTYYHPPAENLSQSPSYQGYSNANRLVIVAKNNVMIDGFAKITSYTTNQTPNNWSQTIDYSVGLEMPEPMKQFLGDNTQYLISSMSDDLSIEPLEETSRLEPTNAYFQAYFGTAMSDMAILGGNVTDRGGLAESSPLGRLDYYRNNLRYRVSRTIEAVGKHSFNELATEAEFSRSPEEDTTLPEPLLKRGQGSPAPNNALSHNNRRPQHWRGVGHGSAFHNARKYVLNRLKHYPTVFFFSKLTLVNRVSTLSINEPAGSFRVTETSIAINPEYHPPFTDDWTAEVSVDNTFLQTVRINGTIKGYESNYSQDVIDNDPYVMGVSPAFVPGIGSPHSGIAEPVDRTTYPYQKTIPINEFTPKYANAISGLNWLKVGNNPATNPFSAPIYSRARLFFYGAVKGNDPNRGSNPYRYLNYTPILNERQALASTSPASWNNLTPDTMNPIPKSMSESHRIYAGEIDYSFEFDNRPLNLVRGSVSESLTIDDTFPTQQIAEVFVLGRRLGPVLQDLGTVTAAQRNVTLEVVLPRPPSLAQRMIYPIDAYKAITGIVEQLNPKYIFGVPEPSLTNNPNIAASIKSYVKTDNQTWNPLDGRISVQKSWVWQRAK